MADEPERRIIGALLAEMQDQAKSLKFNAEELPDGVTVLVVGQLDLQGLAAAVMREAP